MFPFKWNLKSYTTAPEWPTVFVLHIRFHTLVNKFKTHKENSLSLRNTIKNNVLVSSIASEHIVSEANVKSQPGNCSTQAPIRPTLFAKSSINKTCRKLFDCLIFCLHWTITGTQNTHTFENGKNKTAKRSRWWMANPERPNESCCHTNTTTDTHRLRQTEQGT